MCFKSVAEHLAVESRLDSEEVYISLLKEYDELNRTSSINTVLGKYGIFSKELMEELIEVYRNTEASNCLYDDVRNVLEKACKKGLSTFLITDGKVDAQSMKIRNIGIEKYFSRIVFTYLLGEDKKKPDTTSFQQILEEGGIQGNEMLYVGDNPYRDFVKIKKLGVHTIRIKREDGQFRFAELPKEYEADREVYDLRAVFDYISEIEKKCAFKAGKNMLK